VANKRRPCKANGAKIAILIMVILLLLVTIAIVYVKFGYRKSLPAVTATTAAITETTTTTAETTVTTTTTTVPALATEPLAGIWMGYLSMDMLDGDMYELEAEIVLDAQSDSKLAMLLTPTEIFVNDAEGDLSRFSVAQDTVQWDGAALTLQYDPFGNGQTMVFTLAVEDRPYGKLAEGDAADANGDYKSARLSMTKK